MHFELLIIILDNKKKGTVNDEQILNSTVKKIYTFRYPKYIQI